MELCAQTKAGSRPLHLSQGDKHECGSLEGPCTSQQGWADGEWTGCEPCAGHGPSGAAVTVTPRPPKVGLSATSARVGETVRVQVDYFPAGKRIAIYFDGTRKTTIVTDNTGRALFRYVAHADLDLYKNKVVLYGDVNMFTDREADNKASPTELDWIVGLAVRWRSSELAVYYEQDQPLDREGLIQKYLAVQLRFSFEFMKQDLGIGKATGPTIVH